MDDNKTITSPTSAYAVGNGFGYGIDDGVARIKVGPQYGSESMMATNPPSYTTPLYNINTQTSNKPAAVDHRKEVFDTLSKIDLTGNLKTKMNLKYLSWAYAWTILKKNYPDASYKIYTNFVKRTETKTIKDDTSGITRTTEIVSNDELLYFTDGNTCYVKVGVIVLGDEEIECLPVMNMHNQSVSLSDLTSVDVNRAIQRAFVKACARHGLGLYVYAGEDLPDKDPIIIDYPAIIAQANSIKSAPNEAVPNIENIKTHIAMLIPKLIQNVPSSEEQITSYVKSQLSIKISQTTVDNIDALSRVDYFLSEIDKQANAQ